MAVKWIVALAMCEAFVLASGAQPIQLEAENGTRNGTTVSTAVPGYSGTGYVTGFDAQGDSVGWAFIASNGLYDLRIRYRSQYGQKGFDATVNGAVISGMFVSNSAFAMHDAGLVDLVDGTNTLLIGGGWNYYEIDRADFIPTNAPPPPMPVPATLVDPQATLAARVLMQDLVAGYGAITWSGQQETNDIAHVQSVAGRTPLIVSGDLINYSPSRVQYQGMPSGYTEGMIALEDVGHVQSLAWHWNAPTNLINTVSNEWWRGFYTYATTFDVAAALANTNSAEYVLLLRDIDAIAVQLQKFAARNIPVLWRPLHESEGGWFWWGAKGPGPFIELWRLLYQRLTDYHGLHNLIWVLTSEDPAWYPGDDVVDVVGVDAYPTDPTDPVSARWQSLLARFDGRKLIALTEFGGVPDIDRMHRYGVYWAWFCPWTGTYGPGSAPVDTVVRIYQSTSVLTLDEANAVPPEFIAVEPLGDGRIQLTGKGPRGGTNVVSAVTDLMLPAENWSGIHTGRLSGGVMIFTDGQSTNLPHRFYRLSEP